MSLIYECKDVRDWNYLLSLFLGFEYREESEIGFTTKFFFAFNLKLSQFA